MFNPIAFPWEAWGGTLLGTHGPHAVPVQPRDHYRLSRPKNGGAVLGVCHIEWDPCPAPPAS